LEHYNFVDPEFRRVEEKKVDVNIAEEQAIEANA
jgi:hypothetical protein